MHEALNGVNGGSVGRVTLVDREGDVAISAK
jgi:hypothetical protein